MKWSWKIARVAGIDLRVHATFVLLVAWLAVIEYRSNGTAGAALEGVLFTLAIFGSVVLHEFGHALTARRYGVATRDITLLPIGGVARLERMPHEPKQELLIALAGPAVTAALAIIFYLMLRLFGMSSAMTEGLAGNQGTFLGRLFWVNVSLLVFNLLPAFPMDGGRVLRAALALRTDYVRA